MNKKHIKEEGLRDWFGKSKSKGGKKGWVNVVTGDSCASDKPGEGIPKCVSSSKRASMSKKERVAAQAAKRREDPGQQKKSGASAPTNVKTDRKVRKEAMEVNGALDEAKDKKTKGSGSKDACYHKVKSRYSVWPSAYASGALVKCRKVGAANWGNKSEETEFDSISFQQFQEKCWKGYEKKGMKKMFGKKYPNCVKKEGYAPGDVDQKVGAVTAIPKSEQDAARARLLAKTKAKMKKEEVEEGKDHKKIKGIAKELDKAVEMHKSQAKRLRDAGVSEGKSDGDPCWDTHKKVGMKMKGGKLVNDCRPKNEETEVSEGAAWTKKSGKNKSGGLNEKGRKSYERENPGSDLKAPSKKVGNPRRKSFCARMKGMRKRQKPSNNTGDDRLSKSLRAWNC